MSSERPAEPAARQLAGREDFPDLPEDEVAAADEREIFVRFLDYQRAVPGGGRRRGRRLTRHSVVVQS